MKAGLFPKLLPLLLIGFLWVSSQYVFSAACDFRIFMPLRFADGLVKDCLSKTQVITLMKKKVEYHEPKGYEFLRSTDGTRMQVQTCEEYITAVRYGAHPYSELDISMESLFSQTCDSLYALNNARSPKTSFIRREQLADLDRLPVALLPAALQDDGDRLMSASGSETTIANYVPNEAKVFKKAPRSLEINYDDFVTSLDVVAQSDFNGDGFDDLLVFQNTYSTTGSWRAFRIFLLTRLSESQKMYVILGEYIHCVYQNTSYVCSQDLGWVPYERLR